MALSGGNLNIAGIIDVHAHVLPGVDDGSRDMEESLELIRLSYEQGVRAVIATPHYSRRGHNQIERFNRLAEELEARAAEQFPGFRLFLGQETFYHEELTDRLRAGMALCMAGSRYVLVEFDPGVSWLVLFQGLRKMANAGYRPVLAHMERYACIREGRRVQELLGCGIFLQMNYESLDGPFFQPEVRWCRKQVLDGNIHMLGTDMHRKDFRPPQISGAMAWMKKKLSAAGVERLTHQNPLLVINDGQIG